MERIDWPSRSFFGTNKCWRGPWNTASPSLRAETIPRIWDAGAAMGQEPYTLSILFAERMGHFAFNNLRIDATDVESTGHFAQVIEAAMYPDDELSRLPEGILDRYFERNGKPGTFRVVDKVRQRVVFQCHDLLSFKEIGRDYSLVVCKNVLLHFQSAGESRSAEDVSSGAGAGRLLRHRADAGDAAGTRADV